MRTCGWLSSISGETWIRFLSGRVLSCHISCFILCILCHLFCLCRVFFLFLFLLNCPSYTNQIKLYDCCKLGERQFYLQIYMFLYDIPFFFLFREVPKFKVFFFKLRWRYVDFLSMFSMKIYNISRNIGKLLNKLGLERSNL